MSFKSLSNKEIDTLKIQFKKLSSIQEKLAFWQNDLNFPYYLNHQLSHSDIIDFLIHCANPYELEELNSLIIEEVKLKRIYKIIDAEQSQSDILRVISDMTNAIPFLQEKLLEIDKVIELNKVRNHVSNIINPIEYETSGFFNQAFKDKYLKGKDIDLSKPNCSTPNLIALINGAETAKLKLLLEKLIKNPTTKKFNSENEETTLKQQILILYYLRILDSIETDTYKNKNLIISKLLNRSETKVKAVLTYLGRNSEHNPLTTSNLESVIKILETGGFTEQAEKAKRDLEKLK